MSSYPIQYETICFWVVPRQSHGSHGLSVKLDLQRPTQLQRAGDQMFCLL